MNKKERFFSPDFIFGVATSAPQIEGAAHEDGKGDSIWDAFARRQNVIADGTTPEEACDFYHRYKEDIGIAREMGVDSLRFSFSWSRIFPEGKGKINQKGIDFYSQMLEELHKNNIMPNATIYHWDLPQALEEAGGWTNRETVKRYGEYAELLFRKFGDQIPMWSTVNEPIATYVGYADGIFAPGHQSEAMGRQANHNILLAHGTGVQAFRAQNLKNSKIGIVVDIWNHHPYRKDHPEDCALAELNNEKTYRSYLNPVFKGCYTDFLMDYMRKNNCMPEIWPGDMELINAPIDYFGLNCYNRVIDCADSAFVAENQKKQKKGGNFQDNDREYYPKAVYDAVHILKNDYQAEVPIYITENGMKGRYERIAEDGYIHDTDRIAYIKGFLYWISRAIEEGNDIRGYYVWSLTDNWEWNSGFSSRYGLTHIDYDTQKRTVKDSGYWYKELIKNRKLVLTEEGCYE